jgi:hypothetical protein
MERIGMRHDPGGDFDMPTFQQSHPLRRHAFYRILAADWPARSHLVSNEENLT